MSLQCVLLVIDDEMDLMEHKFIHKCNLLLSLINRSFRFDLVEILVEMLEVGETYDGIGSAVSDILGLVCTVYTMEAVLASLVVSRRMASNF